MCEIIGAAIRIVSSIAKSVTIAQSPQDFYTAWVISAVTTIFVPIFCPEKFDLFDAFCQIAKLAVRSKRKFLLRLFCIN